MVQILNSIPPTLDILMEDNLSVVLQGAQEDVDAYGRFTEQDERYPIYEGHQGNSTGKYISVI